MLDDCRARLPIHRLWRVLGLPDPQGRIAAMSPSGRGISICSPFRPDKKPGCSVILKPNGRGRFVDFATGDSFDEVDLISQVRGVDTKQAIAIYHELAGVDLPNANAAPGIQTKAQQRREALERAKQASQAAMAKSRALAQKLYTQETHE